MERTKVESKVIASVGYDGSAAMLEIEFHTGRIYQFMDVPASTASWFLQVPEKASFFNRKIRDHYSFRDVTPAPEQPPLLEQLRASLEPGNL